MLQIELDQKLKLNPNYIQGNQFCRYQSNNDTIPYIDLYLKLSHVVVSVGGSVEQEETDVIPNEGGERGVLVVHHGVYLGSPRRVTRV